MMDILHCLGCAETWHNADTTVHGLAIATGALAAAPFAASAAPFATEFGSTVLTSSYSLYLNPEVWEAGGEFLEGATPGLVVSYYLDDIRQWW